MPRLRAQTPSETWVCVRLPVPAMASSGKGIGSGMLGGLRGVLKGRPIWETGPSFATSRWTLKVGSGNAAHMNEYFCVPQAKFLGVTPQDITTYDLPTHPLKEVDIKRAKDALKNDPFIQHYKPWQQAIGQLVKMGVRVEQQALAKHGLNYVIDEYLPQKLANPKQFLP